LAPLSSVNTGAVATGPSRTDQAPGEDRPPPFWNRLRTIQPRLRTIQPRLLALAVGMALLGCAYWPNFQYLYSIWDFEPNYSHGKLVIPIALVILWQRLADSVAAAGGQHIKVRWTVSRGPRWSWIVLTAILAVRLLAYERYSLWLETATFVPAAACLMLTLGGWPLLQRGWPAVVFLLFMLPLPQSANNMVALPLQRIATLGSVFVMQLTGLLVRAEGNVIIVDLVHNPKPLEVALACNGLSMLMTLAATVTATIMLYPLPNWKRLVVLASAIPIALVSNIIRIVATGWCYHWIEGERAKEFAHDWSGYLMMPLALVLVGIEVLILSWLAADSEAKAEAAAAARPIAPVSLRSSKDKIKTKFSSDDI
jgi:exosortase